MDASIRLRRLMLITALVSIYNFIVYWLDWIRGGADYFGGGFWAAFPQYALTIYFIVAWKMMSWRPRQHFFVILSAWLITFAANGWGLFSFHPEGRPYWWSIAEMSGIPVYQLWVFKAAPFGGFFHSTNGYVDNAYGWYFNGGVTFSWLAFNVLALIAIVWLVREAFKARSESANCSRCGRSLFSSDRFCANCGEVTALGRN